MSLNMLTISPCDITLFHFYLSCKFSTLLCKPKQNLNDQDKLKISRYVLQIFQLFYNINEVHTFHIFLRCLSLRQRFWNHSFRRLFRQFTAVYRQLAKYFCFKNMWNTSFTLKKNETRRRRKNYYFVIL